MFIVYTEILGNGVERWYYGTYESREEANEVAYELGGKYPIFHCVCATNEAKDYEVMNLPF